MINRFATVPEVFHQIFIPLHHHHHPITYKPIKTQSVAPENKPIVFSSNSGSLPVFLILEKNTMTHPDFEVILDR